MTPPNLDPNLDLSGPDRLSAIHFMVYEMWTELHGAERPGLMERVTRLETTAKEVVDSAPTKTEKVGLPALVATIVATIVAVAQSVKLPTP